MALSPRRRRRRRSRWLLLGVVLSLATVLVSVVSSAQTDGAGRRITEMAYLDEMRALVQRSTAQGSSLAYLRSQGPRLGREALRRETGRVAADARAVVQGVERADAPKSLTRAHTLLVATMVVRDRAATAVEGAMTRVFGAEPLSRAVELLVRASQDMAASDRIHETFVASLPAPASPGAMPVSRWFDAQRWSTDDLGVFLGSLRSSASPTPVHDVAILVVTTKPPSVGNEGAATVLPLSRNLQLEVVVANVGNSGERRVPVAAFLDGPGATSDMARDTVDLDPGQRRALALGGLSPAGAGPATLTVVVEPTPGESNRSDNQRSIPVVFRG
jgi:hypothetical protein